MAYFEYDHYSATMEEPGGCRVGFICDFCEKKFGENFSPEHFLENKYEDVREFCSEMCLHDFIEYSGG